MSLSYRARLDTQAPWEGRRFKSFENAERYAKEFVRSHLDDRFVPRVTLYHGAIEIAEVRASGDSRVWVDIKNSCYPVART